MPAHRAHFCFAQALQIALVRRFETAPDAVTGTGRVGRVGREVELAAAGLALPEVMTLRERDRAYPDGHFSPRA